MIWKIFAAPKLAPERQNDQEEDMREKLAGYIAGKLLELAKWADIHGEAENIITASWGGDLMAAALEKFRSGEWRSTQQKASDKLTVAGALVPKVIEYNEKNGITPKSVKRADQESLHMHQEGNKVSKEIVSANDDDLDVNQVIGELQSEMQDAASKLEFERAALIRDQIEELKKLS